MNIIYIMDEIRKDGVRKQKKKSGNIAKKVKPNNNFSKEI